MADIYSHCAFEKAERVTAYSVKLTGYEGNIKPKFDCYQVLSGTAIRYGDSLIQQVHSNCGMVILYLAVWNDLEFLLDLCKTMEYSLVVMTLSDDQEDKKEFILSKGFELGSNSTTKNKRSGNVISTYFLKI